MAKEDDSRKISHVKSCTFRPKDTVSLRQWMDANFASMREGIKMPVYHVYHPIYLRKNMVQKLAPTTMKIPSMSEGHK